MFLCIRQENDQVPLVPCVFFLKTNAVTKNWQNTRMVPIGQLAGFYIEILTSNILAFQDVLKIDGHRSSDPFEVALEANPKVESVIRRHSACETFGIVAIRIVTCEIIQIKRSITYSTA